MKFLKTFSLIEFIIIALLGYIIYGLYFFYDITKLKIEKTELFLLSNLQLMKSELLSIGSELQSAYPNLGSIFNNRELAMIIVIGVLVTIIISGSQTRKAFISFLKTLLSKTFLKWFAFIAAYIFVVIFLLEKIRFWEISLLKISIVWYVTSAILSSFRAVEKANDLGYFKQVAKDTLTLLVLIEFIVNAFSMSIIIEIIFLIIIIIVTMLKAVTEIKREFQTSEYDNLRRFLNIFYVGLIALYLCLSIREFLTNIDQLTYVHIKEIILPIVLSVFMILFNYLFVVYSKYELLYIRIDSKQIIKKSLKPYLKIRLVLFCNFNIKRISEFHLTSNVLKTHMNSFKDVNSFIKECKVLKKNVAKFINPINKDA